METHTNGSSFTQDDVKKARYAIATRDKIIEGGTLAPATLAQNAELTALLRALGLAKRKIVSIGQSQNLHMTLCMPMVLSGKNSGYQPNRENL